MARLYPSDVFEVDHHSQQASELETLKVLGARLPDDYAIFHSLHWSEADRLATKYGEIDFVMVNQSGEILVIEQKDGVLLESDEGLIKCYGTKRKALTTQIQRNISGIRNKFSEQHGSESGLLVNYLIYCPDHRVLNVNGAGVDMCRIVDRACKDELAQRVMVLLGAGCTDKPGVRDRILRFFAHTYHVAPDVGSFVRAQEGTYTRMLDGLSEAIDKLEFNPFRLRVIGTAGCGKTQLTLRQAERLVDSDRRVLQLCFNRPLADKLRALMPEGVEVDTYYGFCKSMLESLGYKLDEPSSSDPDYWRGLQEQLMTASIPEDALYDALIIDEGQDFFQEWWDILELFLKDEAAVLWLEDPLQNLRQSSEVTLPDFVTYRETANFRTPGIIARFVKTVLEVDFQQKNPLPGLGVRVDCLKEGKSIEKMVAHRIGELMKMGFSKDQIVILACRGMASSAFASVSRVGSYALRRFTGEYCEGEQVYTEGDVYFDTVYRFKGQQSPAVILIDLDERLDRSERSRHILYCAMTRATVRLELLVSELSPWIRDFEANI